MALRKMLTSVTGCKLDLWYNHMIILLPDLINCITFVTPDAYFDFQCLSGDAKIFENPTFNK